MTEPDDDRAPAIPWVRVVGGVAAAAGVLATGISAFNANYAKAPRPVATLEQRVSELETDLRRRVEALEQYRERQQTFSQTRSAEIDRQIQELTRELGRARDMIEANRHRLDRIVDTRGGK